MAHFAKVKDGKVIKVIVAEQDFINNLVEEEAGTWVQTSYNTLGGVHKLGGTPLRKNFAGIGDIYNAQKDSFYSQQPYPSWTLNEDTCLWEAPVAKPKDGKIYNWNEETKSWNLVE